MGETEEDWEHRRSLKTLAKLENIEIYHWIMIIFKEMALWYLDRLIYKQRNYPDNK